MQSTGGEGVDNYACLVLVDQVSEEDVDRLPLGCVGHWRLPTSHRESTFGVIYHLRRYIGNHCNAT